MEIFDYEKLVRSTAQYPHEDGLVYTALGLSGEVGEVLNQIKKIIRDDDNELTLERSDKILDELGDVFWYAFAMADEMHVSVRSILSRNASKLTKRARENTIKGDKREGDDSL